MISQPSVMFIQTFSHVGTAVVSTAPLTLAKAVFNSPLLSCNISSIEQVSVLTPVGLFFFLQF